MAETTSPPLGRKVIRLFVATTSLAILVLCAANYVYLHKDLQDLALRKLDGYAHILEERLRHGIADLVRDTAYLAQVPELAGALAALGNLDDLTIPLENGRAARRSAERILGAFLKQRPYLTQVRLIGPGYAGRELAGTARPAVELSGISNPQETDDERFVHGDTGLEPSAWRFSEVANVGADRSAMEDRSPTLRLTYAIPRPDDAVAGYVVMDADYAAFLGRMIGRPDEGLDLIFATLDGDWMRFSHDTAKPILHFPVPDVPWSQDWALGQWNPNAAFIRGRDAIRHMTIDAGGGLDVLLAFRMPILHLMAEANTRLLKLSIASLALLLTTALAGTLLSRRLAAPLSKLADRVSRPREEFEPISLPIRGYREVEVLAGVIERLVNSLIQEGRAAGAMLDAVAVGILMSDESEIILRANKAAEQMFGAADNGLNGRTVASLMPEQHRAAHDRQCQMPGGCTGGTEMAQDRPILGLREDGSTFPLEASINLVSVNGRNTQITVLRDVTEQRERDRHMALQSNELEWRATHDQLSGLLNRRGIEDAMRRMAELQETATVIQIDLDRFKIVNDTMGHEAGDTVIRAIAERLREIAQPQDSIGRIGGDEFMILRPGSDAAESGRFAERAMPHLSAPVPYRDRVCRFGVSMGTASGPVDMLLSGKLLKRSDHALYRAKNEGRGQHRQFTPEMERRLRDRASLAADLETAMDRDELIVEYMPKASAKDGRLIGLEALVRWHHPERGALSPKEFLSLAEDLKLTEAIDHRVLLQVLADRQGWLAGGCEVPVVSVNVSVRRLRDPGLVAKVRGLDIPHGAINFELLESIFLDDASSTMTWSVDALREMGIGIEIDDFGTGHASILGITKIRPDWIKIDKALVRDIVDSESSRTLVRAITDMAAPFGIETLAEGVETREQAEILRVIGCSALQGYYVGRPCNAELIKDLLWSTRAASA